ncbi:MAG TPA: hypothetical protein PLB66_06720 [Bacteroidales bacterium]|nr:hypothetical protein [Bacteroidales bacterium]
METLRYFYHPDLSIWLSVDPLSDSLPYLTPYNYCKNSPIVMKDPSDKFPWLAIWGAIEVGLPIYDAYQTGTTIVDPNASIDQKAASVGGFLLGAILPRGGYGSGAKFGVKQAKRLIKAGVTTGKRIDNVGGFASRELLKEHYIIHG